MHVHAYLCAAWIVLLYSLNIQCTELNRVSVNEDVCITIITSPRDGYPIQTTLNTILGTASFPVKRILILIDTIDMTSIVGYLDTEGISVQYVNTSNMNNVNKRIARMHHTAITSNTDCIYNLVLEDDVIFPHPKWPDDLRIIIESLNNADSSWASIKLYRQLKWEVQQYAPLLLILYLILTLFALYAIHVQGWNGMVIGGAYVIVFLVVLSSVDLTREAVLGCPKQGIYKTIKGVPTVANLYRTQNIYTLKKFIEAVCDDPHSLERYALDYLLNDYYKKTPGYIVFPYLVQHNTFPSVDYYNTDVRQSKCSLQGMSYTTNSLSVYNSFVI